VKPARPVFHLASQEEIKSGAVADVYFNRTVQILRARGIRKRAKAEVRLKSLPADWSWGILAGIEEVARLLEGVPIDVTAMDEGTVFAPYEPVLTIEGVYVDAYGVGTAIANAPVLNFALDIMEIDGRPMAKRGKRSGSKLVYRCRACRKAAVVPAHQPLARCACGGEVESLLKPLIREGRLVRDLPPPRTLREHVLDEVRHVSLDVPGAGGPRGDY